MNVDGQTRDLLGLLACQRSDAEIWSGADQTHGHATLVVALELKKSFFRHEVLERQDEEYVDGIDATLLWRELWDGFGGDRFKRGAKNIDVPTALSIKT